MNNALRRRLNDSTSSDSCAAHEIWHMPLNGFMKVSHRERYIIIRRINFNNILLLSGDEMKKPLIKVLNPKKNNRNPLLVSAVLLAWSISDWKGNTRNYIPVSPNDLLSINSFASSHSFWFVVVSVTIVQNAREISLFCVLIEKHGKHNEKKSETMLCFYCGCWCFSHFGTQADSIPQGRWFLGNLLWPIHHRESQHQLCTITNIERTIRIKRLREIDAIGFCFWFDRSSKKSCQQEVGCKEDAFVWGKKARKISESFWWIEMDFKLMWNALQNC